MAGASRVRVVFDGLSNAGIGPDGDEQSSHGTRTGELRVEWQLSNY